MLMFFSSSKLKIEFKKVSKTNEDKDKERSWAHDLICICKIPSVEVVVDESTVRSVGKSAHRSQLATVLQRVAVVGRSQFDEHGVRWR